MGGLREVSFVFLSGNDRLANSRKKTGLGVSSSHPETVTYVTTTRINKTVVGVTRMNTRTSLCCSAVCRTADGPVDCAGPVPFLVERYSRTDR